jgi:uncharacterized protein YvpB
MARAMVKPLRTLLLLLCLLSGFPLVNARADSIPEKAYIEGVNGRRQSYSLSCEARSAVDWARYFGVRIGEKDFLAKLPRSNHPDSGFVGNPNDPWGNIPPASYGVHAQPVASLLQEFGVNAKAQRDMSWDDLRVEIAAGRPVIVWVIGQMWKGTPIQYNPSGGKKTTVAPYEHTMILVGYSPKSVRVVDAYTGQTQTYPLRTFLNSWKVLDHMAITAEDQADEQTAAVSGSVEAADGAMPDAPELYLPIILSVDTSQRGADADREPAGPRTYIVRRGDYLLLLAQRFGVSWRSLAKVNGVEFPYVIHPGQQLKIP